MFILNCPISRLATVPGFGPKIGDRIVNASKEVDVDKEIKLAEKNNVKIVPFSSEQYPHNLKSIYDLHWYSILRGTL